MLDQAHQQEGYVREIRRDPIRHGMDQVQVFHEHVYVRGEGGVSQAEKKAEQKKLEKFFTQAQINQG